MKDILAAVFCWAYEVFINGFFERKSQPLVRVYDFLVGSSCKYCMATRALMVGIGLGAMTWWGALLVVAAVALTYGERKLPCDANKGS